MGKREEKEREIGEREKERGREKEGGEGRESRRKKEKESMYKRGLNPSADLVVRKPSPLSLEGK